MAASQSHPPHADGLRAEWLFGLTIAVAYLFIFVVERDLFTPLELTVNVALGAGFYLWALNSRRLCARLGRRRGYLVYYAVACLFVIGIQWLGRGLLWLVLMPLTVQAVLDLPRPAWGGITIALFLFAFIFPFRLAAHLEWMQVFQVSLQFVPALLFVAAFSSVVARERAARAEVERLAAALGDANLKLREYAAQAEELATAKERNRLAREIHDTLGHYLTVINVQLEAAQAVMDADRARSGAAVAKAQALAKDGLAEVRRSVAALRASPVESRPLPEAIAALAEECREGGIVVDYQVLGAPRRLPLPVETALYRTAQEALTNVRKHARASRVDLRLEYAAAAGVRLTVQDNGVGAENPAESEGRFGLLGMRERISLLGGDVRILTAPGQGLRLEVEVPGAS